MFSTPGDPTTLVSGGHRLEAAWLVPPAPPTGVVVLTHPHPVHGGHGDHPVVVLAAERAAAAGLASLRFDFRGVRASEGEVRDAAGHVEDLVRALAEARLRVPRGPRLGAGYSYGARLLARGTRPPRPLLPALDGLLLLAPATHVPRTARDFGNLLLGRTLDSAPDEDAVLSLSALRGPTHVLVGERDVVAPPEELRAILPQSVTLVVLEGLNHFFARGPSAGETAEDLLAPALDAAYAALLLGAA